MNMIIIFDVEVVNGFSSDRALHSITFIFADAKDCPSRTFITQRMGEFNAWIEVLSAIYVDAKSICIASF